MRLVPAGLTTTSISLLLFGMSLLTDPALPVVQATLGALFFMVSTALFLAAYLRTQFARLRQQVVALSDTLARQEALWQMTTDCLVVVQGQTEEILTAVEDDPTFASRKENTHR